MSKPVKGVMWKDGDNFCPDAMDQPSSIFLPDCPHSKDDPIGDDEEVVTVLPHFDGKVGGLEPWMVDWLRGGHQNVHDRLKIARVIQNILEAVDE